MVIECEIKTSAFAMCFGARNDRTGVSYGENKKQTALESVLTMEATGEQTALYLGYEPPRLYI